MEYYDDTWRLDITPSRKLRVIIVGAGVAGLTTALALHQSGHHVVILEQVREMSEVGAGIQMASNNMRILGRLGMLPEIAKHVNFMEEMSLRRWKDNEELSSTPMMPGIGKRYGAPAGTIHRADLLRVLTEAVQAAGIQVRTNSKVVKIDSNFEARVQLHTGGWVEGDIIVAADGVKSDLRKQIAPRHDGHTDQVLPTGDSAYRIIIPKSRLEHDPEALALLDSESAIRWIGPGGHIVAYPIRKNSIYNMVMLHPSSPSSTNDESWTRKGEKAEMLAFYREWCPIVQKLLSYAPEGEILEWTLNSHAPLPSWVENKVVLIGDASHPMLPYVAQGAAQAMEDAGVLQAVLAKSSDDVELALRIFEVVRKGRAEIIQGSAAKVRETIHMPDGEAQRLRDEKIKRAAKGEDNPDALGNLTFQDFMWGTDVMKDTIERWEDWVAQVRKSNAAVL